MVSSYICIDTTERCVYDFNPSNIGDTIFTQVLSPGLLSFVPHIIYSIDSVLIGSVYHKRLHLTDTTYTYFENWIEGVGSELGLIYASHSSFTDNSYDLICFSENDVHEYLNPAPGFGYCLEPLPPVACDTLVSGIPSPENFEILLYPNPAWDQMLMEIKNDKEASSYEITDVEGRLLLCNSLDKYSGNQKFRIDISQLPSGIYYLKVFADAKRSYTFKVVKSN